MPITEPGSPGFEQHGYYVYGITDGSPKGLAPGVGRGAPVELLVVEDLVAIVSPVPLAAFTPEALRACQDDPAWIEAQVRAHQEVLARASCQATVIPLRFGTVFHDAAGVRAMVIEHAPRFREALTRLAGRQEWGLKISMDEARLAAQIVATCARIQDLDAASGAGLRARLIYWPGSVSRSCARRWPGPSRRARTRHTRALPPNLSPQ